MITLRVQVFPSVMNHLIKDILNNEQVRHPSDSLGDQGIDEGVKCIVRLTFSLAEKV